MLKIKGGDTSWKIIKNYTLAGQHAVGNAQLSYKPENHIIVHVLESGSETKSPLLTDYASVHYMGRLIPSTTYTAGLIFDKSWSSNTFNALTSRPTHFEVRGVVDGFATALQQMHRGDHWVIYIPYQLGYGAVKAGGGTIPAYSTLIFDVRLVDFAHVEKNLKDK